MLFISIFAVNNAYAQLPDFVGYGSFEELIKTIGTWLVTLSIPISIIVIIIAGVRMFTAGGNPQKFKQGMDMLKYAIIGLAVIFIGQGFVNLVVSVLRGGN